MSDTSSVNTEKESLDDFEEDSEEDISKIGLADDDEDLHGNDFTEESTPFATHEVSIQDIVSLALHDMAVKYKGQRDYVNAQRKLHTAVTGKKLQDYRTVRKKVTNMTGLREIRYDCCSNGCMSYSMYDQSVSECLICHSARWKDPDIKMQPVAQHSYFPISSRLQLWWNNCQRAKQMIEYQKKAVSDRVHDIRSDFWSGDLFADMKSKGLFQTETDMAFIMSSDGVKVFKSRHTFCIWPIILVCLNLPPEERFKRRNILVVGFTPGPNNPKDMDSYLWPLVQEFITLDKGLDAWNGYREKDFQLKAYITIVTGDMPGRAKMQGFKGSRALRYCLYCYIQAVNLRSTPYCPLHLPTDLPATELN
jgi:hypothetical protein